MALKNLEFNYPITKLLNYQFFSASSFPPCFKVWFWLRRKAKISPWRHGDTEKSKGGRNQDQMVD